MAHNRIGYLIKEGIKSIFTHGFMSFACVLVIVACLLIMGNFALLAINIDRNLDRLERQNEILAFVDDRLTEEEARGLEVILRTLDNVSDVQFVTREEALENFIAQFDDPETFSDLTNTTFRHRYVIYLDDLTLLPITKTSIEEISGIAYVSASTELSRAFIAVRNIVSVVSVILIAILFVVSVFIMQNTIKLATFSRREEIAIMKIVGASNAFIRMPFVIEGLVLGLLGGVIAFFAQWGIYELVMDRISNSSMALLVYVMPFSVLRYPLLVVFLAVGFVVGTFGSGMAIRNYLKV